MTKYNELTNSNEVESVPVQKGFNILEKELELQHDINDALQEELKDLRNQLSIWKNIAEMNQSRARRAEANMDIESKLTVDDFVVIKEVEVEDDLVGESYLEYLRTLSISQAADEGYVYDVFGNAKWRD